MLKPTDQRGTDIATTQQLLCSLSNQKRQHREAPERTKANRPQSKPGCLQCFKRQPARPLPLL